MTLCYDEQLLSLYAFIVSYIIKSISMSTISFFPTILSHLPVSLTRCTQHGFTVPHRRTTYNTYLFISINNLISGFVFSIHCVLQIEISSRNSVKGIIVYKRLKRQLNIVLKFWFILIFKRATE